MQTFSDYRDGTLTICFQGELDHCAAASALGAVEAAAEEYMPRQCRLDFSGLSFMDSSGIAVILRSDRLLRQSGGLVRIVGCNEQIRRVLELSGLGDRIIAEKEQKEECELF